MVKIEYQILVKCDAHITGCCTGIWPAGNSKRGPNKEDVLNQLRKSGWIFSVKKNLAVCPYCISEGATIRKLCKERKKNEEAN